MRAKPARSGWGALACALVLPATAQAQVQPSIDMRTWRPSVDPEASLLLEPAVSPGSWNVNVGLWTHYAQDPVALRFTQGGQALSPLEHQLTADLVASVGLGDRAELGVDLPAFIGQNGSQLVQSAIVTGGAVPETGIGDLAITAKTTIVSNDHKGLRVGLGVAAIGSLSLPTGNRESFLGEGAVTASLRLLLDYSLAVGAVRWSLGYTTRTEERQWPPSFIGGVTFGDAIPWAVALDVKPKALLPKLDSADRQLWELGLHGSLPGAPVWPGGTGSQALSPVLLAADDRIAIGESRDLFVLVGAEIGLDSAIGVPLADGTLSVGWAPRKHDRDNDGVPDDVDQCPDLPEDRDGVQDQDGCPEEDSAPPSSPAPRSPAPSSAPTALPPSTPPPAPPETPPPVAPETK